MPGRKAVLTRWQLCKNFWWSQLSVSPNMSLGNYILACFAYIDVIISVTFNGNVYHNAAPILFNKATSVFQMLAIHIAAVNTVMSSKADKPKLKKSNDAAKQIFCNTTLQASSTIAIQFFSEQWQFTKALIVSLLYQNTKKDAHMILSTDVFNLLLTWKQIPRAIIQRQLLSAKANPLQWKRIF